MVILPLPSRDVAARRSEEELKDVEDLDKKFKFNWQAIGSLFKQPSMIMIFLQGFSGSSLGM